MLAPTQVEAHVTRLVAVREGLKRFEADDGRAAECVRILDVAVETLSSDPYPTKVPVVEEAPKDKGEASAKRAQKPSTGYGSTRGIV